jgi:hypothetical protein
MVQRMKQEHINVRLPRALWDAVQAQALKNRRSAAAELTLVVERGLDDPPKPAEPPVKPARKARQ